MSRILILIFLTLGFYAEADCVGSSCTPLQKQDLETVMKKDSQVEVPQCDIYQPERQLSQKQDAKDGKAVK